MGDFQLNDPVFVSINSGSKPLEGVVAHIGRVEFADEDDWIGVRLTGSSSGQGTHDGTFKSKQYFICPENCGVFTRATDVTKRVLSRLEELRLRRELGSTTASIATPAPSMPTTPTSSRPPGSATKSTSTPPAPAPRSGSTTISSVASSSVDAAPADAAKNKLEELRKRRALLKEKRQDPSEPTYAGEELVTTSQDTQTSSSLTGTTTTLGDGEDVRKLRNEISALNVELEQKEKEMTDVRKTLEDAKKEANNTNLKLREVEMALKEAHDSQKEATKAVSPSKLASNYVLPDDIQEQIVALENRSLDLEDKLEETLQELSSLHRELEQEKKEKVAALDESTKARTEAASYHNQLQAITDQSTARGQSDASHYKERAKLLAEISNFKRKIEQLEKEKADLEVTIEDVTLDKEQIQEEKENLEDRFEELRLDAETAQMEAEELKMELEDARSAAERSLQQQDSGATSGKIALRESSQGEEELAESQQQSAEMVEALQVQNARLREALIRLREQSAVEKMEVTRQLRTVEKQAQSTTDLQSEVDRMTDVIAKMEEEINDLKDMVEQGAAFEYMVEDLSDRVLSLEEDNVMLQSVLREMEEAAELTAEMEEVQADEIKALTIDTEGKNVIIRNLEEAIKMQRRREDDFRRTVKNYKITVDTLRQEKKALLDLQQGGEGEKSDLIASSQKALAKAAQLVADAAAMRKREAQATMDLIDRQIFMHLSNRLEQLLPHNSDITPELGAIKGELLCTKVIGKASKSLEGIEQSFSRSIRPALPSDDDNNVDLLVSNVKVKISDEIQQQVTTMIHQAQFAHILVDVSSDVLRLLVAGQWPDFLSTELSVELGNILGQNLPDLDNMMEIILKSLKEEGSLTVEQSNIGALQLTVQNTMQGLRSSTEREDQTVVESSWNPPGWQLLKDASIIKFSCQGAAAALSLVVNQTTFGTESTSLASLYNRVEQCSSQAGNACLRLYALDLRNDKLVQSLEEIVTELKQSSGKMLETMQEMLLNSGAFAASAKDVDVTLRIMGKLQSTLRGANMNVYEQGRYHSLSPEVQDAWVGVTSITQKIRSIDGDGDDINHLNRTHRIESQLRDAVENEPKLVVAHQKVLSLEKILSSRSKEIAMQNARLSELEKLVAKSSSAMFGRGKTADLKSSEEYNTLKEENRVLTEAMDVMQHEIEMYENEIRMLKDQKTPKRGGPSASRGTPRRSMTTITDLSPHPTMRGGGAAVDELQGSNIGVLEATVFRPALQRALHEANRWKAAVVASSIVDLPPLLSGPYLPRVGGKIEEGKTSESFDDFSLYSDDYIRLTSAIHHCRMVKATVTVVDLTNSTKSPRAQLQEMKARSNAATELLQSTIVRCKANLMQQ